jgi:hypothetical protein
MEDSLPAPLRKPRNVARKRVAKKLKVTETTTHEVSSSSRVVEYLSWNLACCQLNLELSQDIPSSDPAYQGDEEDWDTVGGVTEMSLSPTPAIKEVVPKSAQQVTDDGEPRASSEERRLEPSATTRTEEPVGAHVEEEAPAEAGLVDITSILGAPTVTILRSNL